MKTLIVSITIHNKKIVYYYVLKIILSIYTYVYEYVLLIKLRKIKR